MLKYEWVWIKDKSTGFLNAKKMPLKKHEVVLIFYREPPLYNPQFHKGKPYHGISGGDSSNYGQYHKVITDNDGFRYPVDIINFTQEQGDHPTQKPVPLCEYLIKTYTNVGDTVLDNCMGSGTTGVACKHTGRNFIGMEMNDEYFKIASKRINDTPDCWQDEFDFKDSDK